MSLDARWSALVESGRAEWRRGMWTQEVLQRGRVLPLWDEAVVVSEADKHAPVYVYAHCGRGLRIIHPGAVPNWTDPATLGCLLGLVRERWGNPRLSVVYCEAANPGQSEGWCVQPADNRLPIAGEDYETEAEALIAALEAALEGA